MTQIIHNSHHAGDPIRRQAHEQAMMRFAGRLGLRHYMSKEAIQRVEQHSGPVILGECYPTAS